MHFCHEEKLNKNRGTTNTSKEFILNLSVIYLRFTISDRSIEMCHSREGGWGEGKLAVSVFGCEKVQKQRSPRSQGPACPR